MKALTIRQPWASLIAAGVKTIETRSWSTKYRGPLAIHAGLSLPPSLDGMEGMIGPTTDGRYWHTHRDSDEGPVVVQSGVMHWEAISLPLGAVVATCTLADVIPIVGPGEFVGHTIGVLSPGEDGDPEGLWEWWPPQDGGEPRSTSWHNRTDQLPFGDFTPGRYAWLLTDITPCDPQPAKGRPGLWNWEGS